MIDNKWMDNPVLSDISNEKMGFLTKVFDNTDGMKPKQMLTYFIKESGNASKHGINFTDEETNAILNVMKQDMTPEEIKKIDTIRKMADILSKKHSIQ